MDGCFRPETAVAKATSRLDTHGRNGQNYAHNMQDKFEWILEQYLNDRANAKFGRESGVYQKFGELSREIADLDEVRGRPHLKVSWSAGQGNWAKVPWLALLDRRETSSIQSGVYCVFLFREDMSGVYLTLNQGVTSVIQSLGKREGHRSLRAHADAVRPALADLTREGFRIDNDIDLGGGAGLPANYEASTIAYKLYEAKQMPADSILREDLDSVLTSYDSYIDSNDTSPINRPSEIESIQEQQQTLAGLFHNHLTSPSVGLQVNRPLVARLAASLLAKRFLILTGLSGSGKTRLAQAIAYWLAPGAERSDPPHYLVLPVGPEWTSNEHILGYPDGLQPSSYIATPALRLILRAIGDPDHPYFLILDEMNLSHVERYFADLLSAMESREEIPLYDATRSEQGIPILRGDIPQRIALPQNLFVIGTVNVDETTYMFSPKVLDRANVIEFRLNGDELNNFVERASAPRIDALFGMGEAYRSQFLAIEDKTFPMASETGARLRDEILMFFKLLQTHGLEFGFRVAYEATTFAEAYRNVCGYSRDDTTWFDEAFDAIVVQKFLPKLHGSRSKLEGALWALAWACGAPRIDKEALSFEQQLVEAGRAEDESRFGPETLVDNLATTNPDEPFMAARYPISFDKVIRMWRRLIRDQFVTFAEA